MLKILTIVENPIMDAQGFKEAVAMDFEKYGDKVSVEEIHSEQMRMGAKE